MKAAIIIIYVLFGVLFFAGMVGAADLSVYPVCGNAGQRDINSSAGFDGSFTVSQTIFPAEVTEYVGEYNSANPSVYAILMTTSGATISTSTPENISIGSNATTTFSFQTPFTLSAGGQYRLSYVSAGNVLNTSASGGFPQSCAAIFATTEGSPSSQFSFAYPTAGMTTPLFSPFLLRANGLNSADLYQARVQWYLTQIGTTTLDTPILNNLVFGSGADFMANGIKVPRTDFGFDEATDTTLYASAQLYDTSAPDGSGDSVVPYIIANTTTTATLQFIPANNGAFITPTFASGTDIVATSTQPVGAIENPTIGGSPADCSIFPLWRTFLGVPVLADTAGARIRCEIVKFINDQVANTAAFGNGTMTTAVNMFETQWPISIFFTINNDITIAQTTTTYSGDVIIHGSTSDGIKYFGGAGAVYAVYTSSTLAFVKNKTGFDLDDFLAKAIYAATGVLMFICSIYAVKMFRPAKPQSDPNQKA